MKLISVIIVSDLQAKEVLHVRNALNFLQRMKAVYPQKSGYGDALLPYLENLILVAAQTWDDGVGRELGHPSVCADAAHVAGFVKVMNGSFESECVLFVCLEIRLFLKNGPRQAVRRRNALLDS